ncbi:hypothetical protein K1T71_003466 [Dendrolimus kikuchii]|uniref:Uncharacterized protein n=1 Tax=Dendrolimus kikuchii TaxID=765133 RepID=A0ACC1DCJ4_9NEOP|nr:hypothetical protein K1T71_003466 [Dendrolimus kikuchii]
MENQYITLRRTRTQPLLNQIDSNMTIDQLDVTSNSLPDISIEDDKQTCNLLKQIDELKLQLYSAHSEIEQLNIENRELQRKNEDLIKKNDMYKKVMNSPVKLNSPPLKKKITVSKIDKETQTCIQIDSATLISKSNRQTQTHNSNNTEQPIYNMASVSKTSCNIPEKLEPIVDVKSKLCIISNNKRNKILSIVQDTMGNEFKFCHYLTPNGDVQQLLKGLQEKLINFSFSDYCIILIGDEDFQEQNNNQELVNYIRKILKEITHTNVIICTPSYHYGYLKDSINQRIQNFNNSIYFDLQKHNYAYLFDTNLYLVYDYSMFYKWSGKINNIGLRVILKNLALSIHKNKNTNTNVNNINIELKFDCINDKFFL